MILSIYSLMKAKNLHFIFATTPKDFDAGGSRTTLRGMLPEGI